MLSRALRGRLVSARFVRRDVRLLFRRAVASLPSKSDSLNPSMSAAAVSEFSTATPKVKSSVPSVNQADKANSLQTPVEQWMLQLAAHRPPQSSPLIVQSMRQFPCLQNLTIPSRRGLNAMDKLDAGAHVDYAKFLSLTSDEENGISLAQARISAADLVWNKYRDMWRIHVSDLKRKHKLPVLPTQLSADSGADEAKLPSNSLIMFHALIDPRVLSEYVNVLIENDSIDTAEKIVFEHLECLPYFPPASVIQDCRPADNASPVVVSDSASDESSAALFPLHAEGLVCALFHAWHRHGNMESAARVWESVVGGSLGRRYKLRRESLAVLHMSLCWHGDEAGAAFLAPEAISAEEKSRKAQMILTEWLLLLKKSNIDVDAVKRLAARSELKADAWLMLFYADTGMKVTSTLLPMLKSIAIESADRSLFWKLVVSRIASHGNISLLVDSLKCMNSMTERITLPSLFIGACLSSLLDRAHKVPASMFSLATITPVALRLNTVDQSLFKLPSPIISDLIQLLSASVWWKSPRLIQDILLRTNSANEALEVSIRLLRALESANFMPKVSSAAPPQPVPVPSSSTTTPRVVYNQLISAFSVLGQPDALESILQFMQRSPQTKPGITEYNELIRSCAYAYDSKRAVQVLERLCAPSSSVKPDTLSLRYALLAITRQRPPQVNGEKTSVSSQVNSDQVMQAVQLLEKYHPAVIKADAACFNLMLLLLSQLKLWDQTLELGLIMLKDQVSLDFMSLEFLLRAAAHLARHESTRVRAVECAEEIHAYMKLRKIAPNTALFDLFLLIMCQAAQWKRVNLLWREFEESRLPYSRFTFEPLLRMLSVQKKYEDSWKLWGAAKSLGFRMTATSYEAAIEAAAGAGRWNRVLSLHAEMLTTPTGKDTKGYPERAGTLASLVRACAGLDRPEAALLAVKESKARGLNVVRETTLRDLVELCERKGGPDSEFGRQAAEVLRVARANRVVTFGPDDGDWKKRQSSNDGFSSAPRSQSAPDAQSKPDMQSKPKFNSVESKPYQAAARAQQSRPAPDSEKPTSTSSTSTQTAAKKSVKAEARDLLGKSRSLTRSTDRKASERAL